jgi:hypothetical protein
VIPTLPLAARNRLAELILKALDDSAARAELSSLETGCAAALADWLAPGEARYAPLLTERARSARRAFATRPLGSRRPARAEVLDDAGALWAAGLYFEVHELLEPAWREAVGDAREALQGLIQVAVGYQHLANGNLRGARALLEEGSVRLHGRALDRRGLDAFAQATAASAARVENFDWALVPRFPDTTDG